MKQLTESLAAGHDLTAVQVEDAINVLLSDAGEIGTKVAFLKALHDKGETAEEIAHFVQGFLHHAVSPQIVAHDVAGPMIDVCGTGGDKLDMFNVSTTTMFLLAAGGATVVKHGNRAITSKCGGADVLETLGIRIDLPQEQLKECIQRHGAGFIFAQAYHPAFKAVVPVRKQLAQQGIPTLFNMIGPLLNPARPDYQLVGVFSDQFLDMLPGIFTLLGRKRAWGVRGFTANNQGMDEVSTMGITKIAEAYQGTQRRFELDASQLGFSGSQLADLRGGDAEHNAQLLYGILEGTITGPMQDIAVLNAAAGFVVCGLVDEIEEGIEHARKQIIDKTGLQKLRALQSFE